MEEFAKMINFVN